MNTRIVRSVALGWCVLAAATVARGDDPSGPSSQDVAAVVGGNNQFAFDLYGRLSQEDGNLFFSPYSISTALAMTYAGARGNTEAEMANTLHFSLPQGDLHPAVGNIIADLNDPQRTGYQLSVANRLWGQQGYPFLPEFLNTNQQHYGAGLEQVDFIQNTEQARQTINHWVEQQTQQRIKDLIAPGALTELTRLVLTNAIYFKSDWKSQFAEELTQAAPFTAPVGVGLTVPMMHQMNPFNYAAFPDFKMLELPYADGELSMLALLPSQADGLAELEASLSCEMLDESIEQLQSKEVSVFLPKFDVTSKFGLVDVLASMGMPEAFAPGVADFSGMDGTRNLYISDVIHKGFVNVDEAGTEAAAATAVVISFTSAPSQPVEFRADHPFLFLIRDNSTQSILFMGRVTQPIVVTAVPEPSMWVLLSTGLVGLLAYAWRRRRAAQV